ncbi:MAG: radical SAM protein [Verrucomicrobiae bacterium]|nr:radical SAM protein [Verrucomicrobiae bacterium]
MNTQLHPIEWIDEYAARLRDFVFVRETDCLLIKVPNEAHKLNPSGIRILKRLFGGESIRDIWQSFGGTPEVQRDLYDFFIGLKQTLQGCLNEQQLPKAVVTRPFALGFNTLPVLSEVALTYRCNLKCRFCYANCSCRQSENTGELSTEEIRRILRIIREEAEVPGVSFTGGEPLLREDLAELIRFSRHEAGLRVNLITNGVLADEAVAGALKTAGLHSAQVSLESPEEDVHDRLTQVPGSHRKTLAAIRAFRAKGVIVHTNTTINRMNRATVAQMPAFVRELGLERFSMNLIIPNGRQPENGMDLNLNYSEMPELIRQIQEESARQGVEFMWYSPIPVCIFNPVQHRLGNKGCAACDGLLSISPTGHVLPCSSWMEPVGNVLKEGFRNVWESARARALRQKEFAMPLCRKCPDFALCQGACPLYWRHFGFGELNQHGEPYVAAAS